MALGWAAALGTRPQHLPPTARLACLLGRASASARAPDVDAAALLLQPQLTASVYLHVASETLAAQARADTAWAAAIQLNGSDASGASGGSGNDTQRAPCASVPKALRMREACLLASAAVTKGRAALLRRSAATLQQLELAANKHLLNVLQPWNKVRHNRLRGEAAADVDAPVPASRCPARRRACKLTRLHTCAQQPNPSTPPNLPPGARRPHPGGERQQPGVRFGRSYGVAAHGQRRQRASGW